MGHSIPMIKGIVTNSEILISYSDQIVDLYRILIRIIYNMYLLTCKLFIRCLSIK